MFKQRIIQYKLNELVVTFNGKSLLFPHWLHIYHYTPPVDLIKAVVYDDYERKGVNDTNGDGVYVPRYMNQIYEIFQNLGSYSDTVLEEYAADAQILLETKLRLKALMKSLSLSKVDALTESEVIREINKFLIPFLLSGNIDDKNFFQWTKMFYKAYLDFQSDKISLSFYFQILLYLFLEISTETTIQIIDPELFKQHQMLIYNLAFKEGFIQTIPLEPSEQEVKPWEYYIAKQQSENLKRERLDQLMKKVQSGVSLAYSDDLEKGKQIFLEILEEDDSIFDAWDCLGFIYTKENQLEEAAKCYKMILSKYSQRVTVMVKLGVTYFGMKQYTKAIDMFVNAIDYNSLYHKSWILDIGEIWHRLALMYSELKLESKAKEACEKALQVYEHHPDLRADHPPEVMQVFFSGDQISSTNVLKQELNREPLKPKPNDLPVITRKLDCLMLLEREAEAKRLWEKGKQLYEERKKG